jgi:hypothetical protein
MKRFFALFTVVALLTVAGSAFAANPTVTANPSSVTVTVGGREEVAITATAGNNGGTLGAFSVTGGAGATVSGSGGSGILTLAPTSAGIFAVTVSVTETYQESGIGGHIESKTAPGSVTVSVTVNAAYQGEPEGDAETGMLDANVPEAAVQALAEKLGGSVKPLDTNVEFSKNKSDLTPGQTFSDSEGNQSVCLGVLPNMTGLSDGVYLVKYTFPSVLGSSLNVTGSLKLLANGKMVSVKAFDMKYDAIEDFSNVAGKEVYLAFKVDDGTIVDNVSLGDVNAAFDLVDPLLVASKSGGGSSHNPGSSGGGCSAGFTALALAVLGGFIASRRK